MMASNARHHVPRRQAQCLAKISRSILEIVPALALAETTSAGVLPASLGERRLIGAIPAKRPKRSAGLRCVAAIDNAIEGPRQTCPGDPSIAQLPRPTQKGTSVESECRRNTLFNSGGAWRRSESGNRAETLKNDLVCALVRAATHLSYLTDRC